jgi:uncharacterized protein with ParB-like and HNH nuclease domain
MNVEAHSQLVSQLLKKGKFIIPDYQREYDWTDTNLDDFINDIQEDTDNNYFIGHMVCEGDYNGTEFKVIDGQQRITTITIILCVLRDIFINKDLKKLANGLHENYIFSKDTDYNEYVILDNQMPYPILQSYVQSKPEDKNTSIKPQKSGERKIISAYNKFLDIFNHMNEEELKLFRDKILNLEVIFVAVHSEVDAFTIFETLNAKGKDLTPLDLIKNQVFKNYIKQPHIDEPNDSWKSIVSNTETQNIKFLNNFWASRYKKVSDTKIYKEFTKVIKSTNKEFSFDYNKFVSDLLEDSINYKTMITPKKEDWNKDEFSIFISLNALLIFNVKVANAMALSLLREYKLKQISLKYIIKALTSIEKFHFLNNAICSLRSSGLDTMYSRISKQLYKAKDKHTKHNCIDEMIIILNDKIPDIEIFNANIDEKLYYTSTKTKQKKLVQYVLNKIELKKQNGNVELLNMSIEHIYPENPNKDWTRLQNIFARDIGNLVLLDSSLNSKIGDKSYIKKKKIIMEESTILSTKEVFDNNEEWNENNIKKRKIELCNTLYKTVWE